MICYGHTPYRRQGFTFIEILVVLLIFTMVFTLITFSAGLFSSNKLRLNQAYYRLIAQIQLVQEKALMNQTVIKMQVNNNRYQFLYYQTELKQWVPFDKPRNLRPVILHKNLSMSILGEQARPILDLKFYPNGQMSPFTITLTNTQDEVKELIGDAGGMLTFDPLEQPNEN